MASNRTGPEASSGIANSYGSTRVSPEPLTTSPISQALRWLAFGVTSTYALALVFMEGLGRFYGTRYLGLLPYTDQH